MENLLDDLVLSAVQEIKRLREHYPQCEKISQEIVETVLDKSEQFKGFIECFTEGLTHEEKESFRENCREIIICAFLVGQEEVISRE